ncbi:MAG: hypothetical protein OMM_03904 [Candidatus Magnetoglobus multicellularis str. Araruama]|uniref:Toprim domain-containing protein n=1 Tax=Candidatus Magnetoglobus multicellularis str. Araruama TaxID=890399 RepID=A0A1V1P3U9_9BACT|nr:MAG: hypothetical protein OMM_03904 [Candidatus Magnetoglobus multicellularis str. Araruama]
MISDITGCQLQNTPNSTPKHKSNNIHEVIAKYYHQVFLQDAEKQKYQLQVRGHATETIKKQIIGVTDGRLHIHLKKEGYTEPESLQSGFISKENGILKDQYYPGVTVYPQIDINGNVGHFRFRNERKNKKFQLSNDYKNPEINFYNMPAFKQDHIYVVEGEHDAMSLMDIGINNTVATNGQLTEKQLYYIKEWIKSERQKSITLIFDNDDGGKGYTKKFIAEVQSKCFVDLLRPKLQQQNIILKIIQLDKHKDIDEYLVTQGTDTKKKKKLFETLETKASRYMLTLVDQLSLYKEAMEKFNENAEPGSKVKPNSVFMGKLIAEYFKHTGTFFVESDNDYVCSIFYNDSIYKISDNRLFNALMNREAGLNAAQNGFKVIRQELEDFAINHGQTVNIPGWITAKISLNTIYINLCNEKKQLLKISPNNIEILKNGSNQDCILLKEAPNVSGIEYDSIDISQGMKRLKELLFDNFACSEENKFYVFVF